MRMTPAHGGRIALLASALAFSSFVAAPRATEITLTGRVSDITCGLKHPDPIAANCVRDCTSESQEFALVVDTKVYTLVEEDDVRSELYTLAGQMVTITGDSRPGSVIAVASVKPAAK